MAAPPSTAPVPPPNMTSAYVTEEFRKRYYEVLEKHPKYFNCFYKENSQMALNMLLPDGKAVREVVVGTQAIQDKMNSTIKNAKVRVLCCDSQYSLNGGVVVQVAGLITLPSQPERRYSQTFFLAPQDKGFFVLNDILTVQPPDAGATPPLAVPKPLGSENGYMPQMGVPPLPLAGLPQAITAEAHIRPPPLAVALAAPMPAPGAPIQMPPQPVAPIPHPAGPLAPPQQHTAIPPTAVVPAPVVLPQGNAAARPASPPAAASTAPTPAVAAAATANGGTAPTPAAQQPAPLPPLPSSEAPAPEAAAAPPAAVPSVGEPPVAPVAGAAPSSAGPVPALSYAERLKQGVKVSSSPSSAPSPPSPAPKAVSAAASPAPALAPVPAAAPPAPPVPPAAPAAPAAPPTGEGWEAAPAPSPAPVPAAPAAAVPLPVPSAPPVLDADNVGPAPQRGSDGGYGSATSGYLESGTGGGAGSLGGAFEAGDEAMGIFLRGLGPNVSREEVIEWASQFGALRQPHGVSLVTSRGYETLSAYVDYASVEAAQAALRAHGEQKVEIGGFKVLVLPKIPRVQRIAQSQAAMARASAFRGPGGERTGGDFRRTGSGSFAGRGGYGGERPEGGRGRGRGDGGRGMERSSDSGGRGPGMRGGRDGGRGRGDGTGRGGRGDGMRGPGKAPDAPRAPPPPAPA